MEWRPGKGCIMQLYGNTVASTDPTDTDLTEG